MAWSGLIRVWNGERGGYDCLTLRFEETQQPGCLVRLYDGDTMIGQALAESDEQAVAKGLELARSVLKVPVTEENLDWVQV